MFPSFHFIDKFQDLKNFCTKHFLKRPLAILEKISETNKNYLKKTNFLEKKTSSNLNVLSGPVKFG
jgi:hypothetical protein